jgi:hypothetical protein
LASGSSQWIEPGEQRNPLHLTDGRSMGKVHEYFEGFDGSSNTEWEITIQATGRLYWRAYNSGAIIGVASSAATLSTGTWYHIVGTYNNSNTTWVLYIDGFQDTSVNAGAGPPGVARKMEIGAVDIVGSPANFMNGVSDEVRISNSARSADWILTEYHNQSAPGTYISAGPRLAGTGTRVRHVVSGGL